MEFIREKLWYIPQPSSDNGDPEFNEVTQTKFFNEYHPTSHKIFDRGWYLDLSIENEDGRVQIIPISRVAVPFQAMSIDIILSHLLGNKTYLSDSMLKDNPSLPLYREYWDEANIDIARYKFVKNVLSLGDGALIFYRDKNRGLMYQSLSMFDGDEFYMEFDKYNEPLRFFKYYGKKCDVYDENYVTTYVLGENDNDWVLEISQLHGFKGMPVVYHYRPNGAFWTPVQSNIETLEKMLSRLNEDNKTKFKSVYNLKTNDPDSVRTIQSGNLDMVVTDTDGDFKLIPSAEISTQFEFEYNAQKEIIFDSLGIVFPKHKSSGDMPTGSMKMMFYPTERVVMSLINELDDSIDKINEIVKQGFTSEFPKASEDILNGNIKASIRLFTPQDDVTRNDSISRLLNTGVISEETAAEECSIASNNEMERKRKQYEEEIDREKQRADTRIPYMD